MEITNIKIRKVENHAKIAAVVSVTFDDVFVVNDIKVVYGTKGIFAAMPSRMGVVNGEERHMDIAHPISTPFRNYITEKVLEAYNKLID